MQNKFLFQAMDEVRKHGNYDLGDVDTLWEKIVSSSGKVVKEESEGLTVQHVTYGDVTDFLQGYLDEKKVC